MKLETRTDEIISLMESDLARDHSDEISKGNWMKRPDDFKYKISHGTRAHTRARTGQRKHTEDGHCLIRLHREGGRGGNKSREDLALKKTKRAHASEQNANVRRTYNKETNANICKKLIHAQAVFSMREKEGFFSVRHSQIGKSE